MVKDGKKRDIWLDFERFKLIQLIDWRVLQRLDLVWRGELFGSKETVW